MFKYYTAPVVNGGLEDKVAYPFIVEALQSELDSRMIKIKADYYAQLDWEEITEEEYNTAKDLMFEPPA